MTIVFVRHARTEVDADIHPSKWVLSDLGNQQANLLVDRLQQLDFVPDFIYTSTEDKTVKTVEPYNQTVGGNIFALSQFDELHLPNFTSQEEFEAQRKQQFKQSSISFDGSETPHDALSRFQSGVDLITEDHAIICTHGTILTLYLADYNDWDLDQTFNFWKTLPFGEIVYQID